VRKRIELSVTVRKRKVRSADERKKPQRRTIERSVAVE
jgi:hypothetical protein